MPRTRGGKNRGGKSRGTKKAARIEEEDVERSPVSSPVQIHEEVGPREEEGDKDEGSTHEEEGLRDPSPVLRGEEDGSTREEEVEERDRSPVASGGESSSRTVSEPINSTDSDEDMEAVQPLSMYFPPSEYGKKIKLATRCYIHEVLTTLDTLKDPLTLSEKEWFEEHLQFKHIFHMPRDKNHKVMGMWLLLLRTACIERKKEVWFVVNGVPIRYGLREHALISGLDCRNYPPGYKEAGSLKFKDKHFGRDAIVRLQDVKAKLEEMESRDRSKARLKMAVLYFLASIVIAQRSVGQMLRPWSHYFSERWMTLSFARHFHGGDFHLNTCLERSRTRWIILEGLSQRM